MPDVKWIKITTDMFEDEKIDFIISLPESDAILVIWIRLLVLAGKCNAGGYIYLTEKIPYTEDMLSHKFRKPQNIVKLALETFKNLGMMDFDENGIFLCNWDKHQNIEGMEKIKEQTAARVARHRTKRKLIPGDGENVTHVTQDVTQDVTLHVTQGNATDIDLELDIELDKEVIPYGKIVAYLNSESSCKYKSSSSKTRNLIKARWNEGFRLDDFKSVIDKKVASWSNNPDMVKFLRPETLFGPKFEGYLNEKFFNNPPDKPGGKPNRPRSFDAIDEWDKMTEGLIE